MSCTLSGLWWGRTNGAQSNIARGVGSRVCETFCCRENLCLSVPTLASFGSEIWLCWADPSSLEPDWTQCLRPWAEGRDACSMEDAILLLIENKEELRFVQNLIKGKEQLFFIGLKYVQKEKIWKWIDGSILNPNLLRITGKDKENSCAIISHTEVFSDSCSSDNHWICQKTLIHV
ncbi:killer cell lectin-like receptor subfamily B member 1F isoform X2 [Mus musculus]|uniref:killer cell lectin-like receptor subfamily B member 1F isoform X2 n=1 Tax=Mus musculus TaxID=10090 RepID=UPI0003D7286A|nr:killer cell lectin-like receptor subfamily B member 1F isoform X2 [Mus musculus]|eukprot:XP_006506099.1 PREDICTED: killer cell lectin-like receptor subfamily B member 1F isoform X2 [Mus musculus]